MGIVKFFPTRRKFRKNLLDNIPCLCASLRGRCHVSGVRCLVSGVRCHGELRFALDIAPYQYIREDRGGDAARKRCYKSTFEAVMYMKTNKSLTKCPEKYRTFMYKFRTFVSSGHEFWRKKRLGDDNMQVQLGSSRVSCACSLLDHLTSTPSRSGAESGEKGELKNAGISHDVIENKNAIFCHATMLMKNKVVIPYLPRC